LELRRKNRLHRLQDINRVGARLKKAGKYLTF
jgi:hypothetical protein